MNDAGTAGLRRVLLALVALLTMQGAAAQAGDKCSAMASLAIPVSAIGLPVRQVLIDSAHHQRAAGREPGFCSVLGRLMPMDAGGWPILFQVNLPDQWNGKALQFGGGGTNGVLVTGLKSPAILPPELPSPLAQGFATFGTDAGHPMLKPDPQAFAANEEAVLNQAYASYKKTRDVALQVIAAYFGKPASRRYFFGNSEGGREALMMVQRFSNDYDGAIAIVPAMNWTGQHLAHHRQWLLQRDGGWLNPAKVQLLARSTRAACDTMDGLADGVVTRQAECARVFRPEALRCPDGKDAGDACLSDAQLAFVRSVYEPYPFAFPIANGVTSYPGSPYGGEDQRGGLAGSLMVTAAPKAGDLGSPLPGPGSVRYFFARDPAFTGEFDMRMHVHRVQYLSQLFDATDPKLDAFAAHGKLIVIDYGADYLKSPYGSRDYYQAVVQRLGQVKVDGFFRYFILPGLNHGGIGIAADGTALPNRVDVLSILERWLDSGKFPQDVAVRAHSMDDPGRVIAARPLCPWPLIAQYAGSGDPHQASSFRCEADHAR